MDAEVGDGGWVQERLKAPLNRLCVVRCESDPDKTSRKSVPPWSPGWLGLRSQVPSSPHPQLWKAEAPDTHVMPPGREVRRRRWKRGKWEKLKGKLPPPFSYYCNDLLQAPDPHPTPHHAESLHAANHQPAAVFTGRTGGTHVQARLSHPGKPATEHIIRSRHKDPV